MSPMKRMTPAASPDAYVAGLNGWRRSAVEELRAAVRSVKSLEEAIKWGHLVYSCEGLVLMIRAEDARVLFGFWRGKQLRDIEPRLKPGGMYEMATLELREGDNLKTTTVRRLAREAAALNRTLGSPTSGVRRAKRAV